jgi:Family of unknown function (DUF5317)
MGPVLALAVLATAVGLARGGRPRGWSRLRLRGTPVVLVAFGAQVGAVLLLPASSNLQVPVLATSLAAVCAVLLVNRRVPGLLVVAGGCLLNLAVIAANGAMPVSLAAARRAHAAIDLAALTRDPRHVLLTGDTRLPFLGDVIGVPLPGRPEVVSPGDLLCGVGVAVLVVAALLAGRENLPAARTPRRRSMRRGQVCDDDARSPGDGAHYGHRPDARH